MRRFTAPVALLCCIGVLGIAGCGSSSSSSSSSSASSEGATPSTSTSSPSTASTSSGTKSLATAKFALHAGLGFGAFHHWIYGPIKAGALKHPAAHKVALVKAGLAALFVYHELKLAAENAKSSKLLRPLVAPLTAAGAKLNSLKTSIIGGSVNASEIDGVNSQLAQIKSKAAANGQSITESIPNASQLTAAP